MLANIFVISEGVRVGSEIGSPKNFGWVRGSVVIQQVRYDLLSEWKNNKVYCQTGFCCNALYCTPQQLSISRQCVHKTQYTISHKQVCVVVLCICVRVDAATSSNQLSPVHDGETMASLQRVSPKLRTTLLSSLRRLVPFELTTRSTTTCLLLLKFH